MCRGEKEGQWHAGLAASPYNCDCRVWFRLGPEGIKDVSSSASHNLPLQGWLLWRLWALYCAYWWVASNYTSLLNGGQGQERDGGRVWGVFWTFNSTTWMEKGHADVGARCSFQEQHLLCQKNYDLVSLLRGRRGRDRQLYFYYSWKTGDPDHIWVISQRVGNRVLHTELPFSHTE